MGTNSEADLWQKIISAEGRMSRSKFIYLISAEFSSLAAPSRCLSLVNRFYYPPNIMNSWKHLSVIYGNDAGARIAFEDACLLTLSTKFDGENVQGVRLQQGDGGIDIYVGYLGVEPIAVYQCKFFPDGVSESQKQQIRDSFRTANENENFQLRSWTLCLPQDLSLEEANWFDVWASKQTKLKPQRLSPAQLMRWAEEAKLTNFIFRKTDSTKLDEILSLVRGNGRSEWSSIVEEAELDSARILMSLIRRHVACLNNAYPTLDKLAEEAATGDLDAICTYVKTIPVSGIGENEKFWFFNFLSDFTGEPILHRFIRRYAILVRLAKNNGKEDALSTTELYTTYKLVTSPLLKGLRDAAEWPQNLRWE